MHNSDYTMSTSDAIIVISAMERYIKDITTHPHPETPYYIGRCHEIVDDIKSHLGEPLPS